MPKYVETMVGNSEDGTVFYKRPQTSQPDNSIAIIQGEPRDVVRYFDDAILIGRGSDCDLCVENDAGISRRHVRIERFGKKFRVINLEPRNITCLKNKKVKQSARIKSGDTVKIGETVLQVTIGGTKVRRPVRKGLASRRIKTVIYALTAILAAVFLLKLILPNPDAEVSQWIDKGIKEYNLKNYDRSLALFKRALEKDRENAAAQKYETLLENRKNLNKNLREGKNLFDKERFHAAVQCFQNVLKIDSDNTEAAEYLTMCQQQINAINRTLRQAGSDTENKVKQHLAQAESLVNYQPSADTQTEIEKVRKMLEQAKIEIENAVKIFQATDHLLRKAKNKDPDNTTPKEEIDKLKSLKTRSDSLYEVIQSKLDEYEKQAGNIETSVAEVKALYDTFHKYFYKQKKLYPALKVLEEILQLNVACSATEGAKEHLPKVKAILTQKVKPLYAKGSASYNKGKFISAARYLQKVVTIYPEYKKAAGMLKRCEIKLNVKAKQYFEDGLVDKGIGLIDSARKRWKKVLEVMPVKTNVYYKKAKDELRKSKGR
jgi:tetratricopeptide (TPR) repeat protein